jgi:hypothetical protein
MPLLTEILEMVQLQMTFDWHLSLTKVDDEMIGIPNFLRSKPSFAPKVVGDKVSSQGRWAILSCCL